MAILVNKDTRVVVQGITGSAGAFHAGQMRQYSAAWWRA
jgi:succinyl-CoA synthetase alpha subunit